MAETASMLAGADNAASASIDSTYRDTYSTHIPVVILAVNNNPMRLTDRSGDISRRRVILHFPEMISPEELDPRSRKNKRGAGRYRT